LVVEWPGAKRSLDAFDLSGKRALVLGAATGVGRAIALAFAEAGADLALATVTSGADEALALRKTAREVRDMGRTALEQSLDASSGQGAQVMVRQVSKELGGLDVLVTAPFAPEGFVGKEVTKLTDADWAKVMGLNVNATFFACRAAAKEMLKDEGRGSGVAGRGRIITVASVLGERGLVGSAAYCAAQAGILNLTRAMAQEWAAQGITANAIALGWMEDSLGLGDPSPETNKTVRFVPMKRAGRVDEAAPLALWLASDAAGYVSGQVFYVDGGLTTHL
jgi:NAD(P)-dependent dehydrogenase (short-subunit alcohol dehydrogenase family)